ncbi:hypothetical protein AXF42_Ash001470 [Apostasia shenzhenica]|uniref:Uncharacterized protein n=1 Tax=Apostasia shenzhenica TaxID=1088818 RepID=A0A2I0AV40_9ASPA|nr:hypothetical protein AXF42_Ash001470 [Apostasia shenzhenica]
MPAKRLGKPNTASVVRNCHVSRATERSSGFSPLRVLMDFRLYLAKISLYLFSFLQLASGAARFANLPTQEILRWFLIFEAMKPFWLPFNDEFLAVLLVSCLLKPCNKFKSPENVEVVFRSPVNDVVVTFFLVPSCLLCSCSSTFPLSPAL